MGQALAAGHAGLHGLAFAKVQAGVLLRFGGVGDLLPFLGLLHHLHLQGGAVVGLQGGQRVGVFHHRVRQVDAVHQPQTVGKLHPRGVAGFVLPGRFDGVQVVAQVVALGRHKAQRAVYVHGGAGRDLAAAHAQNFVGDLALGHRLRAHRQRVGGFQVPGRGLMPGVLQQRPGGVHACQHVGAGIVKRLLAGHKADGLPVHLHLQRKRQRQPGAHQHRQPGRCQGGQQPG